MPHYSRIIPVTDYLSRIPVWIGENKVSGILVGDNTSHPFLQLLKEGAVLQVGDKVITSGYIGVYPAGLVIGEIDNIYEDEVRVIPYESGENLSFARLVDFGMNEVLLKE